MLPLPSFYIYFTYLIRFTYFIFIYLFFKLSYIIHSGLLLLLLLRLQQLMYLRCLHFQLPPDATVSNENIFHNYGVHK